MRYSLGYLSPLSCLMPGEIYIAQNVADAYKLNVGDTLFAEYSYSPVPVPVKVASIMQTEYDYGNPAVDNSIGVVFVGFNKEYFASTNAKFMLFAEESKADELAIFPQIINEVINKSACIDIVTSQGTGALIFEALFSLAAVILAQLLFFSKSRMSLYRCYLKGMKRFLMSIIPFVERLVFCLLPCVMAQCWSASRMPESTLTKAFCGAFLSFKLVIALPDDPAILVIGVPDLRPVPTAAAAALHPAGEDADRAAPVLSCLPRGHKDLDCFEGIRRDDGFVVVPDVVLRDFALNSAVKVVLDDSVQGRLRSHLRKK